MRSSFRTALALFALCAATTTPALAQAPSKPIHIGVEGAFPPWNMTNPDGKLAGFDIDLIHDLCQRLAAQCELTAGSWQSLIPSLTSGKFDMVLSVGINADRRKVVDFTTPYAIASSTFLFAKDNWAPKLPDDGQHIDLNDKAVGTPLMEQIRAALKGRTIGVVEASSQLQLLKAALGDDVTLRTYPSSMARDMDLKNGRVDAGFDSAIYARGAVKKPGNETMTTAGPLLTGAPLATDVAIATRKDEPALTAQFTGAIQAAAKDGVIRTLSLKWMGLDLTPPNS